MAGEKYVERATANLTAYLSTNFETYLRQVEVDQGSTFTLPDPEEYIDGQVPFDQRSPLCEVFCDDYEFFDNRNDLIECNCTVAFSWVSDAQIESGQKVLRRYVTALARCIRASRTLTNTVSAAYLVDGSFAGSRGATTETRSFLAQGVMVRIHEP